MIFTQRWRRLVKLMSVFMLMVLTTANPAGSVPYPVGKPVYEKFTPAKTKLQDLLVARPPRLVEHQSARVKDGMQYYCRGCVF